jgi:tetratricopeptide (TPR) repeat protein
LAFCFPLVGCETPKGVIEGRRGVSAYLSGNFTLSKRVLEPLAEKTDQDYVLNNLRLGAAAFAMHDFDSAERAYVRAYQIMNATKVNDAGREAAMVWLSEDKRVWRGEPYERAVANLQLGMLYYAQNDYNNARGAFENALFKLRDYKSADDKNYDEQESDFVIALLMLGRTWTMLGRTDEATRYFDRAVSLRPNVGPLAGQLADTANNVLLYVEYGFGPRKIDEGMDGNALGFYPHPSQAGSIPLPRVSVDGREISTQSINEPLYDTLVMARDRRWQKIDTIRKTKSYLGTGLMAGGAGATIYGADRRDQGMAIAGVGMMVAGALLKASSQADIRTWEMSPRTSFIIPMQISPGDHDIAVTFPTGVYQTWRGMEIANDKETTYLFRMMRDTSREYDFRPKADAPQSVSAADERR